MKQSIISLVETQYKKPGMYLFYEEEAPIKTLSGAGLNAKQPVDPLQF